MATATKIDLKTLLPWSEPKRVNTKNGECDLLTADPDGAFWQLWKSQKEDLRAAGISCGKSDKTGQFEVMWWRPISGEEQAQKTQAIAESRMEEYTGDDIPCPAGLNFYPYQMAGIKYASSRPNVLIADEMGLGKTPQSVGISNCDPSVKSVLVICPASLKVNWMREWRRWDTKGMSVGIAEDYLPSTQVIIVNYDRLAKFRDAIDARITEHGPYDMLVCDEVHYCKNGDAQRTKLVFGCREKKDTKGNITQKGLKPIAARRRVLLTGTPIVNKPADLWTLVQAVDPDGLGKNWMTYHKRYTAAYQGRYGWDISGSSNLDELQNRLRATCMVRRLKVDVLKDLPAITRQIVALPVPADCAHLIASESSKYEEYDEDIEYYRAERDLAEAEGNEEKRVVAAEALREARATAFEEMAQMRQEVALAKVPAVVEDCKETLGSGGKLIVFAHHKSVIDKIMDGLKEFNPVKITGSCSMTSRQAAVDAFQTDPRCRVIVCNIRAAGVGLTLTAATTETFAEIDWTPAAMSQAEARAHRIGQKENVLVRHLVFDGSLDSRMIEAIVSKQNISDRALDNQTEQAPSGDLIDTISLREMPEEAPTKSRIFTALEIDKILAGLRYIAGYDMDHATEINGVGYSKYDNAVGHSLAGQNALTQKQALLGFKLVRKYRKQLAGICEIMEDGRVVG